MKHKYIKNVTTLQYTAAQCVGCRRCTEVCPHGVFDMDTIGRTAYIADKDSCMECGACAMNCPAEALKVDADVGCAAAIIIGWLTGTVPNCGGSTHECCGG